MFYEVKMNFKGRSSRRQINHSLSPPPLLNVFFAYYLPTGEGIILKSGVYSKAAKIWAVSDPLIYFAATRMVDGPLYQT